MKKIILIPLFFVLLALAQSTVIAQFIVPGTDLPVGRAFHGAATLGDHHYVFGGSTYVDDREEVPNSTQKIPILSDGSFGQWEYTTALPEARYYISNATLVLNDTVYIIGGADGPDGTSLDTAIWTRPLENGDLEPWRYSPSFGKKLSSVTAVSTPGYIHIIGGYSYDEKTRQESVSNQVLSSRIASDGSMEDWRSGPTLPTPLWYHHAQVAQGRVWVWGGLVDPNFNDPKPSPYIFSAPILASGLIGEWRRENVQLPYAFYAGSSAVAGPYLMTYSPRYTGAMMSNDVWWTFIDEGGRMQKWQRQPTQIPMRAYHAVSPDYRRGAIYVSGGRWERYGDKLAQTFVFRLSDAAREAAARPNQDTQSIQSRTLASATPAPSYSFQTAARAPNNATEGFLSVESAREQSSRDRNRPLVLYFNLDEAKPCIDQKKYFQEPRFKELTQKASFAWINAPENPQLNQQMGVYRVPTWVFYDRNGEIKGKETGVMSLDEIEEVVSYIEQGG